MNAMDILDAGSTTVLNWFNQTERPHPRTRCIHQLFEEQAARAPDAIALVHRDREMTYRELNDPDFGSQ